MADEDDYMSDKFLVSDAQPGLVPKIFARKRIREETGKKKAHQHKTKSIKVKEAEGREEKLNKSIDESNKGFAMLSKMGFQKGMGLGKHGQGRAEPIPLDLKFGRKGLGTEQEEKRKEQKRHQALVMRAKQKQLSQQRLKGDFVDRQRKKENEYQTRKDLEMSKKCCEQLDAAKNLEMPFPWAWPAGCIKAGTKGSDRFEDDGTCIDDDDESWTRPLEHAERGDDEDELEDETFPDEEDEEPEDIVSHLDELTNYLRATHMYCIWCGTAYDDEDDLNRNCPGGGYRGHEEG